MSQNILENKLQKHIDLLIFRYPVLALIKEYIIKAYLIIEGCYENSGKLLIAGNGGSAADSEYIVGELMKGFKMVRTPDDEFAEKLKEIDSVRGEKLAKDLQGGLPAISLAGHSALSTAYLNDVDGLEAYAQ